MSNSYRRLNEKALLLVVAAICWVGAFAPPLAAQQRAPDAEEIPADDYIARAKGLIHGLYPELTANLRSAIQDDGPWWAARIAGPFYLQLFTYSGEKQDGEGNPCYCETTVLFAHFMFAAQDRARHLFELEITYPAADARQESLGKLVRDHPEWSDAQVVEAFKKAGGKYGPENKDQLLHALPYAQLTPYIGVLTARSAEWVLHRPEKPGPHVLGEVGSVCFWRVYGTSHLPSGATPDYQLLVDAFDGKLSSLVERSF